MHINESTLFSGKAGKTPSFRSCVPRYLKFPRGFLLLTLYLHISLTAIWIVCHHIRGGRFSVFLLCIWNKVFLKMEVSYKPASMPTLPPWSSNVSLKITCWKLLTKIGESRHPCGTATVALKQSQAVLHPTYCAIHFFFFCGILNFYINFLMPRLMTHWHLFHHICV